MGEEMKGTKGTSNMINVCCLRKWKCGFYKNYDEVLKDKFAFCLLCGMFLKGTKGVK